MNIVNNGGRPENLILIGVAIAGLVVGLVGAYLGFLRAL